MAARFFLSHIVLIRIERDVLGKMRFHFESIRFAATNYESNAFRAYHKFNST